MGLEYCITMGMRVTLHDELDSVPWPIPNLRINSSVWYFHYKEKPSGQVS